MGRDEMRAGDSDRQLVADKLKKALDEGRLDIVEYDERLQKTYAAKTYGDLNGLLDDLPSTSLTAARPAAAPVESVEPAPAPVASRRPGQLIRAGLGGFGGIFVVGTVIWLISSISSGHMTYFWPVWLLIPMAFGIMGQFGDQRRRRDRDDRRDDRDDRRDRRR
jgi:hypothetical protein